jgi:predicted PurR-regulated permease PerM
MNNTLVLNPPISIIRNLVFKIKFSWKTLWILSFILIITLLISYIFQINSLAEETYRIQNYQKKTNQISQENDSLLANSLKQNSLSNIETLIKDSGFERAQKIHYIEVLERQVVTNPVRK